MTSNGVKFCLLLEKNWIIQKRHYLQTLFEILIPVLCCSILLLIRDPADSGTISINTTSKALPTDTLSQRVSKINGVPVNFQLAYSPRNPILDQIMSNAAHSLNTTSIGFPNAQVLESTLMSDNILAGVEFDDSLANMTTLPKRVSFALRFPAELRFGRGLLPDWKTPLLMVPITPWLPMPPYSDDGGAFSYYNENFLSIQTAVSKAIIRKQIPGVQLPPVFIQRHPDPPSYDNPSAQLLEQLLSSTIHLSFFYTCIVMVKHITVEKEKQLKEAMKVMGMPNWLHWSAWFAKNIILLMIVISLITVLLCAPIQETAILKYSDWSAIWFFLFVYGISIICFSFMMSVFFRKANIVAGIAGLMCFVFLMPFSMTVLYYDEMSTGSKIAISLFHNSAMSFGLKNIARMEGYKVGLRWSRLFTPATVYDGLSIAVTLAMLLLDALIYLGIALFVEQVMPGQYGVAKPWNFLFKKSFWTKVTVKTEEVPRRGLQRQNSRYFETEPNLPNAGIQIKNLRKVFSGNKVAVEGLNVNMYKDQITVLLGNNGAGKTTTISMLTGMVSPTSGTAYLNGHDIRTDIEEVRQSLGLCPQHNVLFDEMTVTEHLRFFARLKGVPKHVLGSVIERYLRKLELLDKRNAQSQTLSGGMKRKLAVGIALCGGSKVVLLDEPTSGMDPSARRVLWELLLKEKQDRTMILTTHFMDEADVLGDRIAIMTDGVLKTVGSPFFLKKAFGVGYRLTCVKGPAYNRDLVCQILKRYIPEVSIDTDIGSELSFVLKEDYIGVFQKMLGELESQMDDCGISSYGISLTTMEEVFLKAGSDTLMESDHLNATDIETTNQNYALNNMNLLMGSGLLMSQIKGQFLKKFLCTIRSWVTLILQNAIPIFFAKLSFMVAREPSKEQFLPPLKISLDPYKDTVTVLEGATTDNRVQAYQNLFKSIGGSHSLVTIPENMSDYILDKSLEAISDVNNRYMVGATLNDTAYTGWFNSKGYHTAPLALSLIYNAIVRSECPTCEITVVNKPLPYSLETTRSTMHTRANPRFNFALNASLAMAFVSALFISAYIRERTSRSKLLQYVSGTNIILYWAVAFIWDYLMFIVTCLVFVAALVIFHEDVWSSFDELGQVFLLLIFFGVAFLPTIYLCSFLFTVPATGFIVVVLINIASGSIFFVVVTVLKALGKDSGNALEWVFMFFPNFALTHGLNNMNQIITTTASCKEMAERHGWTMETACEMNAECCIPELFSFDERGINRNLLFLAFVGISSFLVILALEYRLIRQLTDTIYKRKHPRTLRAIDEDSDVTAEKKRVQAMSRTELNQYNLVIKNLTKYYKNFRAVNNLSVAIDHSECFGLLGVNGAGKTTTFKMMTGDESFSSGEALVQGMSLSTNMSAVYQMIGYCPQFDALLDDLTGRETLKMYALLRGVRQQDIGNVSQTLAEDLTFLKHIDKKTKNYSGGNKRKLSTAVALMGNPSVVYLDEPTTGMDPRAKRQCWDMICKVRSAGKSIVLTSHSMEECEALCTRLAIMVNGELKCLGSAQHLKNKFSKGFQLTIKMEKVDSNRKNMIQVYKEQQRRVAEVKSFVMGQFGGAVLKEEYLDSLSFHIPSTDLNWSTMFGMMESNKNRLNIEDYALGQTSLEQVFLFFTRFQKVF